MWLIWWVDPEWLNAKNNIQDGYFELAKGWLHCMVSGPRTTQCKTQYIRWGLCTRTRLTSQKIRRKALWGKTHFSSSIFFRAKLKLSYRDALFQRDATTTKTFCWLVTYICVAKTAPCHIWYFNLYLSPVFSLVTACLKTQTYYCLNTRLLANTLLLLTL